MKLLNRLLWIVILVTSASGGWHYFANDSNDKPTFRTEKLTRGNISAVVSANGTLNPVQLVTVGSQVSGKVDKIRVKVNDRVKQGQILAEIDPSLVEGTA